MICVEEMESRQGEDEEDDDGNDDEDMEENVHHTKSWCMPPGTNRHILSSSPLSLSTHLHSHPSPGIKAINHATFRGPHIYNKFLSILKECGINDPNPV